MRPLAIDPTDAELVSLAERLVRVGAEAAGQERSSIDEQLAACGEGFAKPKIAAGLVKLVIDRMTFEEPSDEAARARNESFLIAAKVLRELPDDATPEAFETLLAEALPRPIEEVRAQLYADHPENRRLVEWKEIGAGELLDRYNLAQVQGLVLRAGRVEVRARSPELLRVRKLLRWLKFCRLVADVRQDGDDWSIEVEGPAQILDSPKKYGLQLAMFVAAVPVLERWSLFAEIEFASGRPAVLDIDEKSGLVSPYERALGYVPEEIEVVLRRFEGGEWEPDPTPLPRPCGVSGLCVPDVGFRHSSGQTVFLEFFHRWHRHALVRRLEDLRTRPDPQLALAVDEHLLSDEALRAEVQAHPQAMLFKGFPSERRIRALLKSLVPA